MSAPDTRIIPCSLPTNAFSDALCEVFSYAAETYSTKGFRNLLANKAALHQCKRVCSRWFQWDNFLYTNVVLPIVAEIIHVFELFVGRSRCRPRKRHHLR